MRTTALILALLGISAGAAVMAVDTWTAADGAPLSTHGVIALSLGVIVSLALGGGLMLLVFLSSRRGYDDR